MSSPSAARREAWRPSLRRVWRPRGATSPRRAEGPTPDDRSASCRALLGLPASRARPRPRWVDDGDLAATGERDVSARAKVAGFRKVVPCLADDPVGPYARDRKSVV